MTSSYDAVRSVLESGGWAALDNVGKNQADIFKRELADAREKAHVVADALQGENGAKFLEWLLTNTILRPPSPIELGATTAESYAIAKARREGQNSIAFMILQALDVARGAKTTGGIEP